MVKQLAFVDTISDEEPFEVQGFTHKDESSHIARVQLGFLDNTNEVVSALVALIPAPGQPASFLELQFYIVLANPETRAVDEINDGRQTKRIFATQASRRKVLDVVCALACNLVSLVKPETVNYVSACNDLPPKALHKYDILCEALMGVGYRGGEVDRFRGNHMWILERLTA